MTEELKAIAELGNTGILAYAVCVLAPRGADRLLSAVKWAAETWFREMSAEREICMKAIGQLTAQIAALATQKDGGAVHRPPSHSGPPAAGPEH